MTYRETLGAERKARLVRLGWRQKEPQVTPIPVDPILEVVEEPEDPPPALVEKPKIAARRLTRGDMVKEILQRVCKEFDVTRAELFSDRRKSHFVRPRHVAMYLIHTILKFTQPHTGRIFKRDHTCVIQGRDKCLRHIAEQSLFGQRVARLEMLLRDQWNMPKYREFRYAPNALAEDFDLLGWLTVLPGLEGTHHEEKGVLMEWICPTCPPIVPKGVP